MKKKISFPNYFKWGKAIQFVTSITYLSNLCREKNHSKIQRSKNTIFNKAGDIPVHLSNFQCALIAC